MMLHTIKMSSAHLNALRDHLSEYLDKLDEQMDFTDGIDLEEMADLEDEYQTISELLEIL